MRIEIPVFSKRGPEVTLLNGSAYVFGPKGDKTWAYNADNITGKGIFVCGCARSGTKYMTEILMRLGYDIGHERAGKDGSVGYHLTVIKPENCFHQVRDPIDQISSMMTQLNWGFMDHVMKICNHGLLGCMQYWLGWNELCEEFCTWRYRLEDIPWLEFLERIDHPYESMPDVPKNVNARRHKMITWADLFRVNDELAEKIRSKSIEYGYSIPKGQIETTKSQVAVMV